MIFISALILGFLSSWHCIGMCGPLVMAVHSAGGHKVGALIYNIGRILVYAILGGIMGTIGMAAFLLDIQQYFAILLGIVVLILIFKQQWLNKLTASYQQSRFMKFVRQKVFNKNNFRTPTGKFFAGMANGLLPCGLVYVALAGSMAQSSVSNGMLYMVVFGFGTLPAMMLTHFVPVAWMKKIFFKKWAYAGMLVISCLFFYRAIHIQSDEHKNHLENNTSFDGIPLCSGF